MQSDLGEGPIRVEEDRKQDRSAAGATERKGSLCADFGYGGHVFLDGENESRLHIGREFLNAASRVRREIEE